MLERSTDVSTEGFKVKLKVKLGHPLFKIVEFCFSDDNSEVSWIDTVTLLDFLTEMTDKLGSEEINDTEFF